MTARFVPIEVWPGEARKSYQRKHSPFRGSWKNTFATLDRELTHLGAKDVLVQAYLDSSDIRMDGWPRSSARPCSPGVVVSFQTKDGDLCFPCDTYTSWEDNLRAIALALSALRAVERYGVTRRAEQYRGWAKLPPASDCMTGAESLEFIALYSGVKPTAENFKSAYRSAAMRLHPDNQETGNAELFKRLGNARQALVDAYGWTA
jgi:hypothetical protein